MQALTAQRIDETGGITDQDVAIAGRMPDPMDQGQMRGDSIRWGRLDQPIAGHHEGQLADGILVRHIGGTDRRLVGVGKALARLDPWDLQVHRSIVPSRRIFRCSWRMP